MAEYPKMYHRLFNEQTRAIATLEDVIASLKRAQKATEDMYINAPDPVVMLTEIKANDEPDGEE
jgi:hypothetical protein